jgi:hypothetical protein
VAEDSARLGTERNKRGFTEAEVGALLSGDPATGLRDAMSVAALSGMKLGNITG